MHLASARRCAGLALLASVSLSAVAVAQPGTVIGQLSVPGTLTLNGLGSDPAGNLWLTGTASEVIQMSTSGAVITSWTASMSNLPYGIATDGTNIFIADVAAASGGPDIDVYDPTGTYIRSFSLVGVSNMGGLAYRPQNGHLYVISRTAGRVYEYDLTGNQISSTPLMGAGADGLGHDFATDQFWVNQSFGDMCDSYDSSFNPLTSFPGATTAVGARGGAATFSSGVFYVGVRAQGTIVMFDTTGTAAGSQPYGTACPQPGIFYEQFTGTGTGDLTGGGIRFVSSGRGWTAVPGGSFETNLGTDLMLADDGIQRNQALGFTFTTPGAAQASTNAIDIAANGWIGLVPNEVIDTGFYVGASGAEMIRFGRIAAWWDDLNPAAGGAVYFNQLSNPQRAVITWDQVPQFGMTDSNTLQLKLFPNGDFELYYQAGCADDAIVGFSSGNGVADPGSLDLSATIPGTFGPYGAPLTLSSTRPVVAAPVTYVVTNIPANAVFGGIILGQGRTNLPLDGLGMTGCTLLSDGIVGDLTFSAAAGQLTVPIPTDNALIGVTITNQALVVAPGQNPLGVIATNGLEWRLGT